MKALLIILFSIQSCFATTYYVKVSGGTGSGLDFANAWSYAYYNSIAGSLAAGSGVNFLRGETYYGALIVKVGVSGNPTTYGTYGSGANPVISGFSTLTGWTPAGGNVYYVPLTFSQVQNVTVDGVQKSMGRYPNTGYLTYTSHSGNSSISGSTILSLPNIYVGGEVVIKKNRYIIDRHKITAQAGSTISYNSTNFYGQNTNYDPTDGNGYIIQNHINTLDQDGERCYDASTSRLYMYFAGSPTSRVVKATTVLELCTLNSASYVTFNNIDFEGGITGVGNYGSSNIIFNTCNFRQHGTGIYGIDCTNIQVNGGSMSYCTTNALFFELNGTNTYIESVNVYQCGLIVGLGESGDGKYGGLGVEGNGTTMRGNYIHGIGFNGINFSGNDVLIETNRVDSTTITKDDGGGIYTHAPTFVTKSNRIIRFNIVTNSIGCADGALYNGDPNGEGAAIYLDGNTNHTTVYGNTCAYGNWAGIFNNGNSDNTYYRNTILGHSFQMLFLETSLTSGNGQVRNILMYENMFIARSGEVAMEVSVPFVSDPPINFGTFKSNFYARPANEGATIRYSPLGSPTLITLATWQSTYSQDKASLISQVTTGSDSNIRLDFNYTASPVSVNLGTISKEVSGTNYIGTMGLEAYGGKVSVFSSSLPSTSTKIGKSAAGKIFTNAGKVSTITD